MGFRVKSFKAILLDFQTESFQDSEWNSLSCTNQIILDCRIELFWAMENAIILGFQEELFFDSFSKNSLNRIVLGLNKYFFGAFEQNLFEFPKECIWTSETNIPASKKSYFWLSNRFISMILIRIIVDFRVKFFWLPIKIFCVFKPSAFKGQVF